MANPLAKVIRYLVTGGTVTAGDVQGAIEQLETITTGIDTLLLDHDARHATGGADELNVGGLFGVLADQQVPSSHDTRHQTGGDDEIDVTGLLGKLNDEQDAGWLKGAVIDVTGLAINYCLQYDGTKWIVTDTLTGVTPGVHESTHVEGGSDEIQGELADPQKAGKIYGAVISIAGLADKWHLRYDQGINQWVAQSFYHAADHEQGQPDAIPSLPTPDEKDALVGTQGLPAAGNEFVTLLDKTSNINPFLPTADEKAALSGALLPGASNPYVTISQLNNSLAQNSQSEFGIRATRAFIHDPVNHKKGSPIVVDISRETLEVASGSGSPTDKPMALLDRFCTIQTGLSLGSCVFDSVNSEVTVTNNSSTESVASIVADNGSSRAEITLTAPPAFLGEGDTIVLTGAESDTNNGQYTVFSVALSVVTLTNVLSVDQLIAGGTVTSSKFRTDGIINVSGTASNNFKFTITSVNGNVLGLFPAPVNETVATTADYYLPNGSIMSFGLMFITDGTPEGFAANPTTPVTYEYDSSSSHIGTLTNNLWILGEQISANLFMVNIHENPKYGQLPVRITNADSPYIPVLTNREILCDSSGGNIIINFPSITAEWDGVEFTIKARVVGVNSITVNSDAADDIDGLASLPVINTQYQSWTIKASYDAGGNSFWSIK